MRAPAPGHASRAPSDCTPHAAAPWHLPCTVQRCSLCHVSDGLIAAALCGCALHTDAPKACTLHGARLLLPGGLCAFLLRLLQMLAVSRFRMQAARTATGIIALHCSRHMLLLTADDQRASHKLLQNKPRYVAPGMPHLALSSAIALSCLTSKSVWALKRDPSPEPWMSCQKSREVALSCARLRTAWIPSELATCAV